MNRRHRIIALALLGLAGGLALNAEPVLRRDIAATSGPLRLTVGAVRAPLWSAAFAQQAGDLTLENLTVAFDSVTFAIKSIRFSDVTSTRAEIDALFSSGATELLSTRLSRIKAKAIVIPEIAFATRGALNERGVYRDVVLTDIADGRVGKAVIEFGDGRNGLAGRQRQCHLRPHGRRRHGRCRDGKNLCGGLRPDRGRSDRAAKVVLVREHLGQGIARHCREVGARLGPRHPHAARFRAALRDSETCG